MHLTEARQLASEVLDRDRSESTTRQYDQRAKAVLEQLSEAGRPATADALAEHAAACGWRRSTYEQSRTALRYHLATSVREWAREADRARRRGDADAARDCRRRAVAAGKGINEVRQAAGDELKGKKARSPARGLAAAQHHAADRGATDWRMDIAWGMRSRDDVALVAVLAATGARPAELVDGIELELDGDTLIARIQGAKVNGERGQPVRELRLDANAETTRQLAAGVKGEGGRAIYAIPSGDNENALRQRIERTAERLGYNVTSYSFRHQFASDLKATMGDDVIAKALGHAADKSIQAYGRANSATGGTGLLGASASREVRATANDLPSPAPEPDGPTMGM